MVLPVPLRHIMPKSIKRWDVAVIGGGLAGTAAAIRLAGAGRKVLLLEKEVMAHDKVCGEFISFEATRYLGELGLDLEMLHAERITDMRLIRGKRTVSAKLPFHALSLSRRVLDEAMLLCAQSKGAHIRRGATATAIEKESQGWRIKIAGANDILAETIFLATGKHDLRGRHRTGETQDDFIGFKMHFRLTSKQKIALAGHVEMILFNGGYAGLEPVEDGKANLCLVVLKSHFVTYGKNWDGLLNKILEATPLLANRLAGAEPCWRKPLSIFGIPYGFVYRVGRDAPSKLYRLGDQMAVIPSFSGYGMSIALHTGMLAVEHYLHSDDVTYHRLARNSLLPLVRRASWLSKMAEFPLAQKGFLLACDIKPNLLTAIAAHTRIGRSGKPPQFSHVTHNGSFNSFDSKTHQ